MDWTNLFGGQQRWPSPYLHQNGLGLFQSRITHTPGFIQPLHEEGLLGTIRGDPQGNYLMIAPDAPPGVIAHEATHDLYQQIYRLGNQKINTALDSIPGMDPETLAYGISNPLGNKFTYSGKPVDTSTVANKVIAVLKTGTPAHQKIAEQLERLRAAHATPSPIMPLTGLK